MQLDEAWTIAVGSPIKFKDGLFGKVTSVDLQNEVFLIEKYLENYSIELTQLNYGNVKTVLRNNNLYETRRQALMEI